MYWEGSHSVYTEEKIDWGRQVALLANCVSMFEVLPATYCETSPADGLSPVLHSRAITIILHWEVKVLPNCWFHWSQRLLQLHTFHRFPSSSFFVTFSSSSFWQLLGSLLPPEVKWGLDFSFKLTQTCSTTTIPSHPYSRIQSQMTHCCMFAKMILSDALNVYRNSLVCTDTLWIEIKFSCWL